MASIYELSGATIMVGLQGSAVCDEAIIFAKEIAAEYGVTVVLEDDGEWLIGPRGGRRRFSRALKVRYGWNID